MWRIEKEFHFDAAHWLPSVPEDHKCRRMHGHTYRVRVRVRSLCQYLEGGMVIEYGKLAEIVKDVLDRLDHYCLNEVEGLSNPTTENLARWIFEELAQPICDASQRPMCLPDAELEAVIVHESSTTMCEYAP